MSIKKIGDWLMIGFVIFLLALLFLWTEFTDGGYYDNKGRENRQYQNEVIINER